MKQKDEFPTHEEIEEYRNLRNELASFFQSLPKDRLSISLEQIKTFKYLDRKWQKFYSKTLESKMDILFKMEFEGKL